jgi:hypothetical protein
MQEAFIEISTLIVALVLPMGDGILLVLSSRTDGLLPFFRAIKYLYE